MLAASLIAAAVAAGPAAGGAGHPRPGDLRCLSECAGLRAAAVGGKVRLSGHRLGQVSEVRFVGDSGAVVVAPDRAEPKQVVATVPPGAASGLLRVANQTGGRFASKRVLRIAGPGEVPDAFKLLSAQVNPQNAFFDQARPIRLRYRFEAAERSGVRIEVMRVDGKKVIRAFRQPNRLPYTRYERGWNGLENDGDVADDGAYRFRVGAFGEPTRAAGQLRLHGYKFPVRGSHGYGGYLQSFGAPRTGGRRHQGQDVYAACGTKLEAARGGKLQAKAYDSALYGHYVVIDIAKSSADHMYAHMPSPSPFGQGDRVHTGQRIGAVGKTGNARTTPCHLHFEIWPNGWRNGNPVDPKPALKRWDGWS